MCILTVHGVEYAFGAHDYPTSGVFEVEPRQCPGFKFRKAIFMGTTCLDPGQFREFMERYSANYNGDTYHLIIKNCNHFCEDICNKLTGNRIPKWVNRLARIGILHSTFTDLTPSITLTLTWASIISWFWWLLSKLSFAICLKVPCFYKTPSCDHWGLSLSYILHVPIFHVPFIFLFSFRCRFTLQLHTPSGP